MRSSRPELSALTLGFFLAPFAAGAFAAMLVDLLGGGTVPQVAVFALVTIASELGIPVKLIGIGEALEDLRPFDADDFAAALVEPRE